MSANIDRIRPAPLRNAENGDVRWSPVKSLWWSAMCLAWLIGIFHGKPLAFSS